MASIDDLTDQLEDIQGARDAIQSALNANGADVGNDIRTFAAGVNAVASVKTVNNISADANKNVTIDASNINVDDTAQTPQTIKAKLEEIDNKSTATNILNGSTTGSIRGINTTAESSSYTMGQYAFAEGLNTKASGNISHAEGQSTTASGLSSHAEGQSTTASSPQSHAEGIGTTASSYASHAEGNGTKASGQYQHVQGKYNIEDSNNKYAHIVGNGTGSSNRNNAHTLDWNGNGWFAGNVYVRGTDQDTNSHVLIADDTLVEYKYRDKTGLLDENNLADYIREKYDSSCSGISSVQYYGQPGSDVMYAVYYYQNGYLSYEPIGIYKYHSPSDNTIVWIDGTTRVSENGSINNVTSDTTSIAYLVNLYTTNLTNITIQYNGGGRFPEFHDITTTYTLSGDSATCTCNNFNFSNYDSIRAKLTYSDGTIVYTDEYSTGGGAVVCFTGNTLIDTETGFKPISEIEIGDKVYSYNFENKEIELKEVDKIFSHTINEIVSIYTEREIIEATKSHPFYVAYNQKKLAKNLKPNDLLRTKQNLFRPIKQVIIDEVNNKEVYEIRVKDNNNYFVGSEGILVYNEPNILED